MEQKLYVLELSVRIMDDSYTVQLFHGTKTLCARAVSKNHGWLLYCNSFREQKLYVLEPSVRIMDDSYTVTLSGNKNSMC